MTPEHQLVQQIRELINSDRIERNPVVEEFSEQYAELCHAAISRLDRCAEYLAKGMRSEAVHEAFSPPPLLTLVDTLNFPEVKKWRNICLDLEIASFPPIPEEIVHRLRRECTTERSLEPLLKEYRRYVYSGDRDKCIELLRQLRVSDPDNPSWPDNLRPLEQARIPETLDKVFDALDRTDKPALQELYNELTHPQRAVKAPADILDSIRDVLMAERRQATALQGSALIRSLEKALDREDEATAEKLLEDWAALSRDEAFKPDRTMLDVVKRADGLWERIEQRRKEEERFEEAVAGMWVLLNDRKTVEADIRRELERLKEFNRPLPDSLRKTCDETLDRIRGARLRRQRTAAASVLAVVLALIAAAAIAVWTLRTRQRHDRMLAEMSTLLADKAYDDLSAYLQGVMQSDPGFYNAPDVMQVRTETEQALARKAELEKGFRAAMDELDLIRSAGFDSPEERIRGLLAKAGENAVGRTSEQAIKSWETSWIQWQQRQQRKTDAELNRVVTLMQRVFEGRRRRAFDSLEAEGNALASLLPLVDEGKRFAETAGEAPVATYNDLVAQTDAWQRDYQARLAQSREASTRLTELRRDIPKALPDQVAYMALLEAFVKEFPDEPESAAFRRVLSLRQAYAGVVALQDFRLVSFPPPLQVADMLNTMLADGGPLPGSPWETDVRYCLDYLRAGFKVRQQLPTLLLTKSDILNLKVLYYRKKGETDWRPLYYPEQIASRLEKTEDGMEYKVYWGKVYYYENREQVPYLAHTSDIFAEPLNTLDYEIRTQPREQDNLVGHGKFLYRFMAEAAEAREPDIHLLNGIKSLLDDREIELVPRAWLLKRLSHFVAEQFPQVPGAADMVRIADSLNTDVPWMNPDHPDTIAANETIPRVLRTFPDVAAVARDIRTRRTVLTRALNRRVRCVGGVVRDENGRNVPFFVTDPPAEVWVMLANAAGMRPYFKEIGTPKADGTLSGTDRLEGDLFPGQLLFAPGDDESTREVLDTLLTEAERGRLERPTCWPINVW